MTDRFKVASYIRVSTPTQAQEGESLSTQTEQIKHFVKVKGWRLVGQYEDRGLSGSKADTRPGFMRMIEDAGQGKFEGIVFSRLSRFARNTADFLKYQKELKDKGVNLFSIKEGLDPSTRMGDFAMKLMSLFAEWERETIREQMGENRMARWRDRRVFVGQPPYGYLWNKESKCIEVNDEEAAVVREIVRMYGDLSMSMKDIAFKLSDRRLKCRRAPFTSGVICGILKNPAYYGHCVVNRHVYEDGKRGSGTRKTNRLKPAGEHIVFEIPPLISKKQWDKIQARKAFNRTKARRTNPASKLYWLRDLLVCGECGGKVTPHNGPKRKDGTAPRYYSCHWATQGEKSLKLSKKQKCDLPYSKASLLEADVWDGIMRPYCPHATFKDGKLTWDSKPLSELVDSSRYDKAITETTKTVESLGVDLKRLKASRERIFDLIEDDRFDRNEMASRLNRNREDTLTVEGKLKEANEKLIRVREAKKNDGLYRRFMRDKKSVLKKLADDLCRLKPDDLKRLAEGTIVGKITVEKGYNDESDTFWAIPKFSVSPNMELLKQFMQEGKIAKLLRKNSVK